MIVFLDGKFLNADKAKISIFDHGFMYGDGVFERLRTYGGKVWNLSAHTRRLFNSAKLMRMHIPWKPEQIKKWILQTIKKNGFAESSIRIELTRGVASKDLHYDFISKRKPTLNIMVAALHPWPKDLFRKGISCTTYKKERSFPEVKTTSLIAHTMALQDCADKKGKEALLIDCRGAVTEGTTSNVFFVKKGVLLIPKARVLPGTTGKDIVKIAKKLKIPTKKRIIKERELYGMDEAFLTSVTRGVMPISTINGKKLKQKVPGKITSVLSEGFQKLVTKFANAGK